MKEICSRGNIGLPCYDYSTGYRPSTKGWFPGINNNYNTSSHIQHNYVRSFGVNRTITYSEPVNFIDSGTNYTGRYAVRPPDDQQ